MTTANGNAKRVLLVAIGLTLALLLIPYGHWLTYPFLIFATFIHETCHALATVLTGGKVESITVALDGSGLTLRQGGLGLLIVPAGYIGTALIGGSPDFQSKPNAHSSGAAGVCRGDRHRHGRFCGAFQQLDRVAWAAEHDSCGRTFPEIRRILLGGGVVVAAVLCFYLFSTGVFSWAAGLLIVGSLILVACFTRPGFRTSFLRSWRFSAHSIR